MQTIPSELFVQMFETTSVDSGYYSLPLLFEKIDEESYNKLSVYLMRKLIIGCDCITYVGYYSLCINRQLYNLSKLYINNVIMPLVLHQLVVSGIDDDPQIRKFMIILKQCFAYYVPKWNCNNRYDFVSTVLGTTIENSKTKLIETVKYFSNSDSIDSLMNEL